MSIKPSIIIDAGSGYSKFGYSTNVHPDYIIPTAIAYIDDNKNINKNKLNDLDLFIGDDALAHNQTYALKYPVSNGVVEDWNCMEMFLHNVIFKYLNCNPEEHQFLITENTMNTPVFIIFYYYLGK